MPHLNRLYEKHRQRGLEALAITSEKPEEAQPFLKENPIPFPVLYDADGKAAGTYQVSGIPVTCLVDREGKLVRALHGFDQQSFETEFVPHTERLLEQ